MVVAAGVSAAGSLLAGQSAMAAGRYQQSVAEQNAAMNEMRADDAYRIGLNNVKKFEQDYAFEDARTQMAYMKAGVKISEGTPMDVLLFQQQQAEIAKENIMYDAEVDSYEYKVAAVNNRIQGNMAMFQARQQRSASIISAFGTMVGAYATQNMITSTAAKNAELIKTQSTMTEQLIKQQSTNQKLIMNTLHNNNINILDQINKNAETLINQGYDLGLKHANETAGF